MSDDGWRSIAWRMYLSNTHTHTHVSSLFLLAFVWKNISQISYFYLHWNSFLFFHHLLLSFLFCSIFVFQSFQQFKNKKKNCFVIAVFFFGCLSALFMILLLLLLWLGNDVISRWETCCELSWQHFIFLHHHHDQTLWFDLICEISNQDLISSFSLLFMCVCVLISRPAATDGQTLPSDVSTDQSFQPQVPSRLGIELVSWMFVNLSTVGHWGHKPQKLPHFSPTTHLFACLCIYTRVLNLYVVICLASL